VEKHFLSVFQNKKDFYCFCKKTTVFFIKHQKRILQSIYYSVYFLNEGAFRVFFLAKLRITSSKLIVLAIDDIQNRK